jgi:hypothetical protein
MKCVQCGSPSCWCQTAPPDDNRRCLESRLKKQHVHRCQPCCDANLMTVISKMLDEPNEEKFLEEEQ